MSSKLENGTSQPSVNESIVQTPNESQIDRVLNTHAPARRKFLKASGLTLAAAFLASCGGGPLATPAHSEGSPSPSPSPYTTPGEFGTPSPYISINVSPTPRPTSSLEATPTPAVTASPEATPPADLMSSAISEYAKTMGVKPETVNLSEHQYKDSSGASFSIMSTPDNTPLLIYDEYGGWRDANLQDLATKSGLSLETMMQVTRQENGQWVDLTQNQDYTNLIKENANSLYTSGEADMSWVFGNFKTADWNNILSNWPTIQKELKAGTIPDGLPYNWVGLDRLVNFAQQNNMDVRGFHLIWGDDIPQSILNYSNSDLKKILEFTVRTRVLRHPEIKAWNIGDEIYARSLYQQGNTGGLWPDRFGAANIVAFVGNLVKESNPSAKLYVTEDFVLEKNFPNPNFTQGFINYLKQIQAQGVKIDGVDIENNFWIYDPPDPKKINSTLKAIEQLGIKTITSEETVSVSSTYPNWPSRPKTVTSVGNPLKSQAAIYKETLDAYLANNTGSFGTGGVWDELAWQNSIGHPEAHAMIYDTNGNPKPADYALRQSLLAYIQKTA